MKSLAREAAGRRNGKLGAGKKTEEGIKKCAMNAVKHGMTAKTLVLANESKEYFEQLRQSIYDALEPANEFESGFVDIIITSTWYIRRGWSAQKECIDLQQARMDNSGELKREFKSFTEPVRILCALDKEFNDSNTLEGICRYESRYHRHLMQASAELRRVQDARRRRDVEEDTIESESEAVEEEAKKNEGKSAPKLVEMPPAKPENTRMTLNNASPEVEKEPIKRF